jgi:hypothetical protein
MTNYIRSIVFFVLAIMAGNSLQAQIESSSERLITQLKNGTVPGLQFSKELPAPPPTAIKQNEKESLITQIRKGTAAGMKFMPGPISSTQPAALRIAAAAAAHQPLASEQAIGKPVQSKAEAVVLPKQE